MEGSDLCGRMSKKIRSQATELADLTERLQKQQAYSRLVEARLLELNPAQSLPVTPRHLVGADAASVRNRPKGPFDVNGRRDHNSNSRPDSRVEEPEDSVREGYLAAQERLKDAARLIRHLREALATRCVSRAAPLGVIIVHGDRILTLTKDILRNIPILLKSAASYFLEHIVVPAVWLSIILIKILRSTSSTVKIG